MKFDRERGKIKCGRVTALYISKITSDRSYYFIHILSNVSTPNNISNYRDMTIWIRSG